MRWRPASARVIRRRRKWCALRRARGERGHVRTEGALTGAVNTARRRCGTEDHPRRLCVRGWGYVGSRRTTSGASHGAGDEKLPMTPFVLGAPSWGPWGSRWDTSTGEFSHPTQTLANYFAPMPMAMVMGVITPVGLTAIGVRWVDAFNRRDAGALIEIVDPAIELGRR